MPQASDIYIPEVVYTVQGFDELQRWRRQQLKKMLLFWCAPIAGVVASSLLALVGLSLLAPLLLIPTVCMAMLAPGMSVVYVARYIKARWVGNGLPQMPLATIQGGRRLALPSPTRGKL